MQKFTLIALFAVAAHAADPYQPTAEEQRQIQDKMAALSSHLKALAAKHIDADLLADVDVYRKAAEWILRYPEEFYAKPYAPSTVAALNKGIPCAKDLDSGPPPLPRQKIPLLRVYLFSVARGVHPDG